MEVVERLYIGGSLHGESIVRNINHVETDYALSDKGEVYLELKGENRLMVDWPFEVYFSKDDVSINTLGRELQKVVKLFFVGGFAGGKYEHRIKDAISPSLTYGLQTTKGSWSNNYDLQRTPFWDFPKVSVYMCRELTGLEQREQLKELHAYLLKEKE